MQVVITGDDFGVGGRDERVLFVCRIYVCKKCAQLVLSVVICSLNFSFMIIGNEVFLCFKLAIFAYRRLSDP